MNVNLATLTRCDLQLWYSQSKISVVQNSRDESSKEPPFQIVLVEPKAKQSGETRSFIVNRARDPLPFREGTTAPHIPMLWFFDRSAEDCHRWTFSCKWSPTV